MCGGTASSLPARLLQHTHPPIAGLAGRLWQSRLPTLCLWMPQGCSAAACTHLPTMMAEPAHWPTANALLALEASVSALVPGIHPPMQRMKRVASACAGTPEPMQTTRHAASAYAGSLLPTA